MRPIPEMGIDVPKSLSRTMALGVQGDLSIPLADYRRRNAWVWAAQDAARDRCGVNIFDPLPYLCHDSRCYGSRDGHPLYHDDNHLSAFGNKLLAPMFAKVFGSDRQHGNARRSIDRRRATAPPVRPFRSRRAGRKSGRPAHSS